MAVFNDIQNILPIFGMPAVIITLLGIGRQIDKTTFAALQTGKRLSHNLYLSPILNLN
jgi:hypothetical protein